ncbi:MAG: hypothetical protein K0Q50_2400 [Vampirovibrio sp.]|jgi:hypothetical protein|nr:hypothetical protein [Vampirovibrio sp.]
MIQTSLHSYGTQLKHPFRQNVGLNIHIPILYPGLLHTLPKLTQDSAPEADQDRLDLQHIVSPSSSPSTAEGELLSTLNTLTAHDPANGANRKDSLEKVRTLLSHLESPLLDKPIPPPDSSAAENGLKQISLGLKTLFTLASVGEADDIELCRQQGLDLNTVEGPDPEAPTPLMAAIKARNPETVKALIPYLGPDNLMRTNCHNQTALDLAKYHPSLFNPLYPLYPERQRSLLQNILTFLHPPEPLSEHVLIAQSLTSATGN